MKLPPIPILSDLDGTLIDSKASVVSAFRWWAQLRGLPESILDNIPFGRTSTDAASFLAPHLDATTEGKLLDMRQAEHTEEVVALAGAAELLAKHEPLAIVTSCPLPLATARLRAAGLPLPRHLVTPECWSRGKPDPEPYLKGAALLKAKPSDCVVLEDAPSGVQAGRQACMHVIGLLTTHSERELPGAHRYIRSLRELPEVLGDIERNTLLS